MAKANGRKKRERGGIDVLPSGAIRVRVYAGIDPVSKRRHDLIEVIPAGADAEKLAEEARVRLLNQVYMCWRCQRGAAKQAPNAATSRSRSPVDVGEAWPTVKSARMEHAQTPAADHRSCVATRWRGRKDPLPSEASRRISPPPDRSPR
ncbi:hypothetical protein [Kribbella alba]|uniref:hypothetical protein n=1 Tax=Kribbella alba TaxID=190197 RepID=UPI0031CFBC43